MAHREYWKCEYCKGITRFGEPHHCSFRSHSVGGGAHASTGGAAFHYRRFDRNSHYERREDEIPNLHVEYVQPVDPRFIMVGCVCPARANLTCENRQCPRRSNDSRKRSRGAR